MSDRKMIPILCIILGLSLFVMIGIDQPRVVRLTTFVDTHTGLGQLRSALLIFSAAITLIVIGIASLPREKVE